TGRPYWVSIEAQPIMDEAGTITQFMAIERDITEQLKREQQLEESRTRAEEANQVKSRFLAMMSHEVRTPLNGVLGSLGLLQDTALDAEQRKYVTTSRSSAEWLLAIINNILDFSKMEAGKIKPEPGVFSVRDLLDSVVEILEPRLRGKPLCITSEIDPGLPEMVKGDAGKIRQVLLNLASNAVKFTEHGQVTLGASPCQQDKDGLWLRFTVTDTGAGISTQDQQRLFEEFWSGQQPATMTGTGLGLTISRQLVEVLGGNISLDSQPGAGSRFWFDIPLAATTPEETAAELARRSETRQQQATAPQTSFSGRILVAEDNPANQMIAQSMLSRLGLSSDVVANGLEAVEALRNRPYDLVLMDIGMPEMDGIEATSSIRALQGPAARTPIIALTAHVMSGEREDVLSQGLDDYLAKPVNRTELSLCLARWLPVANSSMPATQPVEDGDCMPEPDTLVASGILQQLFEDVGSEMAPQVLASFIQELQDQTSALETASDRADLDALGKAAHRLKSSAASFGAIPLSSSLSVLEQAARSGQMESVLQAMPGVSDLAVATLEQLLKLQAANPTI
ncbi:MAG: response regulator, partial [Gammaproteobacteria bacterium]|nr:response regulator [Gammaproteobacteria bacterium]